MERKTGSSLLFFFPEVFIDFLPPAFGSVLSEKLLWLSGTLRKETKSKGGPCWGAMPETEPSAAYAVECHGFCRTACSISLLFGSSPEVF